MSDSKRAITFDRVIRVIATLAIIAVAVWLIGILSNVLLPFCVACIISYLHGTCRGVPAKASEAETPFDSCLSPLFWKRH